jgi:Tfp pilus assembly protein PilO
MKVSLRSKNGAPLVAALAAAGAVAYLVWGLLPQRAALAELQHHLAEKQQFATQGTRVAEELAQATEELLVAQDYAWRWSGAAPRQESLITLFRDINHLSQIAGTRNLRLEPAPVESLATLWRSPVSLSIEGSFPQLFEFVRGVELLSAGVQLTSIEIDPATANPGSLRMRGTLTVFGVKPDFPVTQFLPNSR